MKTCANTTTPCRAGGCGCSIFRPFSAFFTWCCIRAWAAMKACWAGARKSSMTSRWPERPRTSKAPTANWPRCRLTSWHRTRGRWRRAAISLPTTAPPATDRMRADARGAEGYPNLTNNQWIWGGEPERVLETIQPGRQALMTPFGDMLSDQEITRTAAYVQQLAGRRADATMAAAGKKVFDMHCVACHGPDGTGNIHLGAPDLTAGVYTYGGDLNTIRTTIRSGRNGQMPAQLELLGEARTRLVAAYVLSLNQDDHAEK